MGVIGLEPTANLLREVLFTPDAGFGPEPPLGRDTRDRYVREDKEKRKKCRQEIDEL